MYDTIVLKSPSLCEEQVQQIYKYCNVYQAFNFETEERLYQFTSSTLDGSYDYRIRVKLDNTEWVRTQLDNQPRKIVSDYYIIVECSLHKLLLNHNVYGGPRDIQKSVRYLIEFLEKSFRMILPFFEGWEVKMLDVAKIFKFDNKNICKKIIKNFKNMYYSRRKPYIFDTSVMFKGSTTTNKFYFKGAEFKKHDYKRIKKYLLNKLDSSITDKNYDDIKYEIYQELLQLDKLQELAYKIIRFECSIKKKKLIDTFNTDIVYVKQLNDKLLFKIMKEELKKLIKEVDSMDIIRRSDLVLERLEACFSSVKANSLYATWTKLVQFGEEQTKEGMSKPTYYRHVKDLKEVGISWNQTGLNLTFSIVPDDFSFCNNNYVMDEVHPEVIRKLKSVS